MKITPSPCLVENEEIPVIEAVRKMNSLNVNYVLLTNAENKITGIFTERDLLLNFEAIMSAEPKAKITHFMHRQVKTLPIGLIQTAPEFMRDNKIRHLPITLMNQETGRLEVVGMLTSESIYKQILARRGLPNLFPAIDNHQNKKIIGVASPDGSLWKLMEKVFSDSPSIEVERFRFSEMQKEEELQRICEHCDALIVDVDDAPERYWRPAVEFMAKNIGIEYLVIALTERLNDNRVAKLLSFEQLGLVHLAKKPIDISKLVTDFERYWRDTNRSH